MNEENQNSLWPAALRAPAGWTTVHGPQSRQACLSHIEENWPDLRPAGLAATMRKV